MQVVVKDGDESTTLGSWNLVSVVWVQFLVVGAMLGVGLVWALDQPLVRTATCQVRVFLYSFFLLTDHPF